MKAVLVLFVLATLLPACAQQRGSVITSKPTATNPVDLHTSQNSLDWAGVYEGVLPCADCTGIKTSLTLNRDGTYKRMTQYLGRQDTAEATRGSFAWATNGNAITLDERGSGQQYSVGEGRLTLRYRDGGHEGSPASNMVLTLVSQAATENALPQKLERYRWTLESATDSQDHPIDALSPHKDHPVLLSFSGTGLSIQGPCNRIIGTYRINDARQFTIIGGPASTMMACDPALMNADTALSGILAKPLHAAIDDGSSPRLRLLSASNDTLTFTGQATPEALYGAGTRIFLEVAPREVACEHPPGHHARCLQVRERHYDEQGLVVGTPGEWRPLYEDIEGFTHKEGVRNVLRINRFNRGSVPAGSSSTLYVLDLIVESEVVTP
ncbi:MAG TPA: copper resistance protein NlpE N-terminal domain-containing protein [Edaphobacter sp.]|jgi:heat shock protein HslJ|nr:copper resistance protein NlpE N-terminal domain-containing protein [Edaphobacter sp.]